MKNIALLSAALLLAPACAFAADQNTADLTCVVVGMRMSQSPDGRTRTVSVGTIMYFMGKLDGRSPNYDLQTHLADVQSRLTQDALLAEARRCEDEIAARGNAIDAIGRNLPGSLKPPAVAAPSTH
ncbi:MAG TPA: hypothetical protein VGU69_05200 [Rhizomicrobium sp.]|nr:hypothetical protein [Rhizomicrobium sp.]